MIGNPQLIINNDSKISNSPGRSRRPVRLDLDVVMAGLFGWKKQELGFSKVEVKAVLLHQLRFDRDTV